MALKLPELPYARDALAPHMSEKTLDYHYGEHHSGYVDKTNAAIKGTELEDADLPAIIQAAAKDDAKQGLFNNAAQVWNHTFFWNSLSPGGGGKPDGELAEAIDKAFGSYDDFAEAFKEAATGRFGSGWAWLVNTPGGLDIETTLNADTPLVGPNTPLLTLDVWEHAYYLDHQNDRGAFVDAFLEHLVNWDFAASNYAAKSQAQAA